MDNKKIEQLRLDYFALRNLEKIAKSLHHLYETACNQELTKNQETRQRNLELKACHIARGLRLGVYFQCDPRGMPLYLVPNGEQDYTRGIMIHFRK